MAMAAKRLAPRASLAGADPRGAARGCHVACFRRARDRAGPHRSRQYCLHAARLRGDPYSALAAPLGSVGPGSGRPDPKSACRWACGDSPHRRSRRESLGIRLDHAPPRHAPSSWRTSPGLGALELRPVDARRRAVMFAGDVESTSDSLAPRMPSAAGASSPLWRFCFWPTSRTFAASRPR